MVERFVAGNCYNRPFFKELCKLFPESSLAIVGIPYLRKEITKLNKSLKVSLWSYRGEQKHFECFSEWKFKEIYIDYGR